MGPGHLHSIEKLGGGEKVLLLSSFAVGEGSLAGGGGSGGELGVPDPFGGDDEVYEETFRTLERYVELTMEKLSGEADG